jgi:hypothetical protein
MGNSCRWENPSEKSNVVPVSEHHKMKAYRGAEVKLHIFITSALDGSEWSTF